MSSPQDAEWRHVVVALDIQQERFERAEREMAADLDALRSDLAAGYTEMVQANQDHARRIEADRRAWLASYGAIDDEPAQEPAPHQPQGAPAIPAVPGTTGAVRITQPNPHAADLELAEDLYSMSLQEYGQRRAEFGIGTSNGLFS